MERNGAAALCRGIHILSFPLLVVDSFGTGKDPQRTLHYNSSSLLEFGA